jgi:hypothetical protein
MNYGDLIRDAFRITLRNRYLWFFGFFAGGVSLPSGPGNFNPQAGQGVPGDTGLIVSIVVVVVLIVLFVIFLALVSQGALADSVAAIDRGEGRRFGSAFRSGLGNFWRVLGYYIVFLLVALGLLVVIGIPVALLIWGTFAAIQSEAVRVTVVATVGILTILLLIVVSIPFYIIAQYALRDIVVSRERVLGSVGSGYGLLRHNLGRSLLIWLIQLGLSIGIGIALILVIAIVALVLFMPTIVLAVADSPRALLVAAGAPALLIVFLLFLVVAGAIGTFSHAYWTLAYLRLAPGTPEATPRVA